MAFKIHVKARLGGVECDVPVDVSSHTTMAAVKRVCSDAWGIDADRHCLVFDGFALGDSDTCGHVCLEVGFQLDLTRVVPHTSRHG